MTAPPGPGAEGRPGPLDVLNAKDLCAFEGPALEVEGLAKTFDDGVRAVDGVSFRAFPGEILGLLGPNGAGKTTIIHMLLGLTTPTSGRIRMFGLDFDRHRCRILGCVNFSSTYVAMPYSLTVRECLKVFARLYGVPGEDARIASLAETFEMTDLLKRPVRTLSTGQLTRLNLAKALINDPKLLFLDEPTASLDPDIAEKTRSLLLRTAETRKIAVVYTSHNMIEMERVSRHLLFLHRGRIIAEGRPDEIVRRFSGRDLEDVFIRVTRERKA